MIIGFNNDVEHRDKIFHIQTEDHGSRDNTISTMIFYQGQILDIKKISYKDVLEQNEDQRILEQRIKKRMARLHHEFYRNLRSGKYDALAGFDSGEASKVPTISNDSFQPATLLDSIDKGEDEVTENSTLEDSETDSEIDSEINSEINSEEAAEILRSGGIEVVQLEDGDFEEVDIRDVSIPEAPISESMFVPPQHKELTPENSRTGIGPLSLTPPDLVKLREVPQPSLRVPLERTPVPRQRTRTPVLDPQSPLPFEESPSDKVNSESGFGVKVATPVSLQPSGLELHPVSLQPSGLELHPVSAIILQDDEEKDLESILLEDAITEDEPEKEPLKLIAPRAYNGILPADDELGIDDLVLEFLIAQS